MAVRGSNRAPFGDGAGLYSDSRKSGRLWPLRGSEGAKGRSPVGAFTCYASKVQGVGQLWVGLWDVYASVQHGQRENASPGTGAVHSI